MRSGGNNFNYFPENKLTKLANFVQFIRMFCLEGWGAGPPLATPLRQWELRRCQSRDLGSGNCSS